MNISAPFINRPIGTWLLAAALLMAGAVAFLNLPVAPLPRADIPTINVRANLPGASPTTMATAVAMPLERRFGRIAGVTEITSTSSLGTTSITVQFELDRNQEDAAREIQAAIQAAGGDLPPNLPNLPRYRKVNPADSPILILALKSKSLPLPQVFEAANTVLAQKIAQVPGVGQVGVGGGVQPAVRVRVDPATLAGLGLSMEDVRAALGAATANTPKGGVGDEQWHSISVDDQLIDAAAWRDVIIRWSGRDGWTGGGVRLGDIAEVTDDVENHNVAGWLDGERVVSVIIRREPGANILEVIDNVKALLPELAKSISPAIDVEVSIDRATTIRASVAEVEFTLIVSILLVTGVVFVFLRSGRATAIPAVAVPLSLVATFGAMYALGYSLDNLSLMALTIATGFVVDDAIVVTENIMRLLEHGMSPREAALKGAKQIGFTIVSITASLLAVFIPLLFMGGAVGRLFKEFAVVLAVSISLSAVISLTLTPMMCSELLRPHTKPGRIGRLLDRGLARLVRGYGSMLRVVLRHRIIVGVLTIGTVTTTVWLYTQLPTGLFPQQDTGMLIGRSDGPQDMSFTAMKERQEALAAVVQADPDVKHVISNVGGFGARTVNTGSMFISLVDKPERTASADEVIARLRPKLAKVTGVNCYLQVAQDVRIGGRSARTQYQYTMESADLAELDEWAPKLTAALSKLPELKDVVSDQESEGLQLNLEIDRDTAARHGITVAQIDNTLYDAFGQRQIATFYTQINQYRVVLEAAPRGAGHGPESLDRLYIRGTDGAQVPLSQLVRVSTSSVALSINHQGQFPATTISFNTALGVSLGQATAAIERTRLEIGMPASIHARFAGTAKAFRESLASQPMLILIALLAVYIVLGVLYESYIHPITILSTLPSAGLGALLALLVTGTELNLIALVGIILLIGIVKKNAILMIDFALELEREGKSPPDAIYEAAVLRFRPILMTTLAALLGALPLALGTGTGSELRFPLGVAIVGGLLVSQLLTLFTTPVTYLALHRFTRPHRNPRSSTGAPGLLDTGAQPASPPGPHPA